MIKNLKLFISLSLLGLGSILIKEKNVFNFITAKISTVAINNYEKLFFEVTPGMLVNYDNPLISSGTPRDLVLIDDYFSELNIIYQKETKANKEAITNFKNLFQAMNEEGINYLELTSTACYRDYALQDSFWQKRLKEDPNYAEKRYTTGTQCVPANNSEHRTGYAFDIRTNAKGYEFLRKNSYLYGIVLRYTKEKTKYTGVMDEYWHYTYVGKEIAEILYQENICLEEYYMLYSKKIKEIEIKKKQLIKEY